LITLDSQLAAVYSNYGKHTVDLFAPGDNSYGPFANDRYGNSSGTSNAAPFVVGLAVLLKSYFPELTMMQIKKIILETVYRPDIKVIRPHYIDPAFNPQRIAVMKIEGPRVLFNSLSISGGILNAEAAVKKAIEMTTKTNRKAR
jgi:subtilisin family serine protease